MAEENGKKQPIVTTQRAYTLRLSGMDKHDNSWRDRLWKTHEAVNKGAKVFGDWLLTMRGGLCHTLADADVPGKGKKPARRPTPPEIKNRRIVLALSWLSVESALGAPESYFVSHDLDTATCQRKNWKTADALRDVLRSRGLTEEQADEWANDCGGSLKAQIRTDAVWVNRSKAFNAAQMRWGASLGREACHDLLQREMFSDYFFIETLQGSEDDENVDAGDKSLDQDSKLKNWARGWLSFNWGTGPKTNKNQIAECLETLCRFNPDNLYARTGSDVIAAFSEALPIVGVEASSVNVFDRLCQRIGWMTGRRSSGYIALQKLYTKQMVTREDLVEAITKLANEAKDKKAESPAIPAWTLVLRTEVEEATGMPFVVGRNLIGEFGAILGSAAGRVSMAHSWIKRAEEQRGKFELEKDKLNRVPSGALAWLDDFCTRRGLDSGAGDAYRIRRSAVDGWNQVVAEWAALPAKSENAGSELLSDAERSRIQAAREVQDTVEKFGDIQLFEALAKTEAKCVWMPDGKPDTQALLDYVAGTDAIAKQQRFKVPAYRHPDALLHPVFCDFGYSRWNIDYAIHRAPKKLARDKQLLDKKKAEIDKAELSLTKAGGAAKRTDISEKIKSLHVAFKQQQAKVAWLESRHSMTMGLWDGGRIQDTQLRWQSKRFGSDIGQPDVTNPVPVSRGDRLGRAVAFAADNAPVIPSGLFDLPEWNGRLQAPRRQLETIAATYDRSDLSVEQEQCLINKRIQSIRWLVTFSAKLRARGPWFEYATPRDLLEYRNGEVVLSPRSSRDSWRGIAFPFWHPDNSKGRGGAVRHVLSRFPGLRILSVDLGHRYAAACVVWETLNSEQIRKACLDAGVETPGPHALYLHLKQIANGKDKKTIYRRIGSDTLPDGSSHPASWARLDRQFLIKLQGEDRDARSSTSEEIAAVEQIENELGIVRQGGRKGRELLVDELMSDAVRTLRLGLRRHGDRARIAFNLTATKKLLSGGEEKILDDEGRIRLLQETLLAWHELHTGDRWNDKPAKDLWIKHIQPLLSGMVLQEATNEENIPNAAKRRKQREEATEKLRPVAEQIARNDSLCRRLHVLWSTQWQTEDALWRRRLRWMRCWLLPRGIKRNAQLRKSIRAVGGLSLTRIASFKSLYQVQKAYRMRPHPEDLKRNIPERGGDSLESFGQRVLDAMERMRENRVKQLASRIAEAALGISDEAGINSKDGKQKQRPTERSNDSRFAACHAVVIENLTHYRPDETQTRRENRQLMSWSSSKVKKYLREACELHGLHLREVSPAYTSRQDSRTGAPGLRCNDVTVAEFKKSPFWRKQVGGADKNQKEGNKGDARERYLLSIEEKIRLGAAIDSDVFRIPVKGGEIFVSASMTNGKGNTNRKVPPGIQADLNAAANIGLRAVLDPDWEGRWWYIPCYAATSCPDAKKFIGCKAVDTSKPLRVVAQEASLSATGIGGKKSGRKKIAATDGTRIVNLWRDPSGTPIRPDALSSSAWQDYAEYWNKVQQRVIKELRIGCGLPEMRDQALRASR